MNPHGESTTLLEIRHGAEPLNDADVLSSGDRREQAALRRVAVWGVVRSTLAVLLFSAILGAMPGLP